MRILLVNPPARSIFHRLGLHLPPLGLLYIAAVLEREGHEVRFQDFAVEGSPAAFDFRPYPLIGITTDTSRAQAALALARRARRAGATVVLGGPHAHYCDEEALAGGDVDFVARGEGEQTLAELARALEEGKDPRQVPGLSFLDPGGEEGRGIRRSAARPPLDDLSTLPLPARHLVHAENYRGAQVHGRTTASLVTSRGCPCDCHFCAVPDFVGRRLRRRTLEDVMGEIDHLYHGLGYRALAFMDDNFTANPRWAMAIAGEIVRRGYDLHLWLFSRPDTLVRHPEMVRLLARAGTRTIFVGVESGRKRTLREFNKRSSPDVAREAVRLLKRHGIETLAAFIIGSPSDTPRSVRALIRFARELDSEAAQFSILTPFPGTRLYAELEGRLRTRDWSRFDGLQLVFDHPHFRGRSLERWLLRANLAFYFRSAASVRRLLTFCRSRARIVRSAGR